MSIETKTEKLIKDIDEYPEYKEAKNVKDELFREVNTLAKQIPSTTNRSTLQPEIEKTKAELHRTRVKSYTGEASEEDVKLLEKKMKELNEKMENARDEYKAKREALIELENRFNYIESDAYIQRGKEIDEHGRNIREENKKILEEAFGIIVSLIDLGLMSSLNGKSSGMVNVYAERNRAAAILKETLKIFSVDDFSHEDFARFAAIISNN